MKLGVNIDHIATLREARKIHDPDPLEAVFIAKNAGADQITIHLREDRRHIDDDDCERIVRNSFLPVNIECSIDEKIIDTICKLRPHRATLVPEKREEVTTEGGLNLDSGEKLQNAIEKLKANEIEVSLFIDPNLDAVQKSKELNADMVELHTGSFANTYLMLYSNLPHTKGKIVELDLSRAELRERLEVELDKLKECAKLANEIGIACAAGHGLNYQNVELIKNIPHIFELNIGQSIIARSVFVGLGRAICEMREMIAF